MAYGLRRRKTDSQWILPTLIAIRRQSIIDRWAHQVRGSLRPQAMPRLELVDHLPLFLDEVGRAVQRSSLPDTISTAADHGLQRLSLGFNLDSVVREYGALHDAIIETARAEAVVIQADDRQVLFECVIGGIADAVSEYERERDAELRRQANEHFAFVAHELHNPLGSALTAFTILQSKTQIGEERAGQTLKRG